SLYLWDWQIGRLWNVLNNKEAAVQAYAQAVDQLEKIRRETLSTNKTWQFDFRDAVEPIYRQYAALNIRDVPETSAISEGGSAFSALNNTLTTLDSLKVSELQSYFANDCIIAPITTRVDAVENAQATAVVSTAILGQNVSDTGESEGQLVVIASFPNGIKKVTQVVANGETVERVINQFRRTLEAGNREYITEYDQTPGRQLYQWLIAPFEPDLIDVQTLVFVNDGLLRSVPMAALYDGEQYLIEKFAIATTPSLTLTNPEPLKRPPQLSALLMGVSQPVALPARSFEALPAVDEELAQVAEILPSSQILLNQELSVASLKQTLADTDYRILHLATHGTFGFDPDENFVVLGARQTSGDFNQVLTIGELDSLIREASGPDRAPIELLTLTACETAIGDRRATLGLAGIAVRAGVKSAIATLWSVGDASSAQLISDFYTQLQDPTLTKAQALQNAQIAMIRNSDSFINQHPYRWASFILIGNWL
ncbi:MAG: CHAT domain-containing protein, partial [Cyanobacteria bacterium J06649_4]